MFGCVTHGRFQSDCVSQKVFCSHLLTNLLELGVGWCFVFICLFVSYVLCSKLALVWEEFSVLWLLRRVAMSFGAQVVLSTMNYLFFYLGQYLWLSSGGTIGGLRLYHYLPWTEACCVTATLQNFKPSVKFLLRFLTREFLKRNKAHPGPKLLPP